MSHMKFKETVKKFEIFLAAILDFSFFVHFLQKVGKVVHLGCVPEYM